MNYDEWVADVTLDTPPGMFVFCPYDDGDFITGLNIISDVCPGALVAIIHTDGQEAVDRWIEKHPDEYAALRAIAGAIKE